MTNFLVTADELKKDMDAAMNSVSEKIFAEKLLPAVLDLSKVENLNIWLSAVGDIKLPLLIKDDQGKPLFIAPAVKTSVNAYNPNGLVSTIRKITEYGDANSTLGIRAAHQVLPNTMKAEAFNEEDIQIWNRILVRYGYVEEVKVSTFKENKIELDEDDYVRKPK